MRLRAIRAAGPAVAVGVLLAGCGSGKVDSDQQQRLDTIAKATAVYEDPDAAVAAGYRPVPKCLESDNDTGAMGLTYVNLRLNQDQQINMLRPELLFYQEQASGAPPKLAGVGYLVPDDGQDRPDTSLGHMDGPLPGVGPGQPDRFELHVWVHRKSPDGPLSIWNKNLKCL